MMKNKMKQTKFTWLRVAGVLPLAAGMMMLFGFTHHAPEIIMVPETRPETAQVVEIPAETEAKAVIEPVAVVEAVAAPQTPPADIPVYNADVMPTFQGGGTDGFLKWVFENVQYPVEARNKNITGTVQLRFIIEKDGSISNIEEISSPDPVLTEAVIRVLEKSPKWTPGKTSNGKLVRVYFTIPLNFVLQGDTSGTGALPEANYVKVIGYETMKQSDATVKELTITIINELSGSDKPVIMIMPEQREVTIEEYQKIDPMQIKNVEILKDDAAIKFAGEKAGNGLVLITLYGENEVRDNRTDVTADRNAARNAIRSVINELRKAGVSKVTYSFADGETITSNIE